MALRCGGQAIVLQVRLLWQPHVRSDLGASAGKSCFARTGALLLASFLNLEIFLFLNRGEVLSFRSFPEARFSGGAGGALRWVDRLEEGEGECQAAHRGRRAGGGETE